MQVDMGDFHLRDRKEVDTPTANQEKSCESFGSGSQLFTFSWAFRRFIPSSTLNVCIAGTPLESVSQLI
jgi:hypothetical protein